MRPDLSNSAIGGSTDASMLKYCKPNMQMVFQKMAVHHILRWEKYAYHNLNSPESDELPDKASGVDALIVLANTIPAKEPAIQNLFSLELNYLIF